MDLSKQIIEIIKSNSSNKLIDVNSKFTELNLDSIELVSLIIEIEDDFNINLSLDEMNQIITVNEFINYIERLVYGRSKTI